MASSESNADVTDEVETDPDGDAEEDFGFLGPGPEESLEMNPSEEDAFSPR